MWACDFETYPNTEKTWVWAWGAANIQNPDEFVYGDSISDFFSWALNEKILYFHNLKFDGAFIVDYLLKNGWRWVKDKPKINEFTTLISMNGLWYSIAIKTKNGFLKIYDSLKKIPLPIKKIATSFNLTIKKGELDYNLFRPEGWQITPQELEYLKNDCQILAYALKIQFSESLKKMTIGADALASFKEIITPVKFKHLFPQLPPDVDKEIRHSYRGGWVYCKQPGEYGPTICFDVNSLYPYAMLQPLPFGEPLFFEGEYKYDPYYPLYVITFKADFKLKKGFLPTLQLKHSRFHRDTDYVIEHWGIGLDDIITLTNIDFELFNKHYNIFEIIFICGYKFRKIENVFTDYINYWSKIKAESVGGKRQLAKLMLNSLYGKFGKNPDVTRKEVSLDLENNIIKLQRGEKEIGSTLYIPVATFITAYARKLTITTAQNNYERFIYSDTDSIHLTGHEIPETIDIHESELGKWKVEYKSSHGKYLGPKRYLVYEIKKNGCRKRKVTCAGMPDQCKRQVTWKNFVVGQSYSGKLVPKYVPGGVTLIETAFTME